MESLIWLPAIACACFSCAMLGCAYGNHRKEGFESTVRRESYIHGWNDCVRQAPETQGVDEGVRGRMIEGPFETTESYDLDLGDGRVRVTLCWFSMKEELRDIQIRLLDEQFKKAKRLSLSPEDLIKVSEFLRTIQQMVGP